MLRCRTGATPLKDLSNEVIGVSIEGAIRLNAAAVTTQVCIGAEYEKETPSNLSKLINEGNRHVKTPGAGPKLESWQPRHG